MPDDLVVELLEGVPDELRGIPGVGVDPFPLEAEAVEHGKRYTGVVGQYGWDEVPQVWFDGDPAGDHARPPVVCGGPEVSSLRAPRPLATVP